LRNALDVDDDRPLRDFRRMTGQVQLFHDRTIPGPYTKEARENWLRMVLEAQKQARAEGPPEFKDLNLITLDELHEIRRIWLNEKHEFDDSLPGIYQ
jgi:DNA sulfur modification protein DndC